MLTELWLLPRMRNKQQYSLPDERTLRRRRICNNKNHHNNDRYWGHLPEELLEEIINILNISDRVRLSNVCKSWRKIVHKKESRFLVPKVPWLLLPYSDNSNYMKFYDMCHGCFYNFKLPSIIVGASCRGSTKGWLVMAKGLQISLFNPISRNQIALPPLNTVPNLKIDERRIKDRLRKPHDITHLIIKIELSSADAANDCIVGAIFDVFDDNYGYKLGFCRLGDKSWNIMDEVADCDDILFSKDGVLNVLIADENVKVGSETLTKRIGDGEFITRLIFVYYLIPPEVEEDIHNLEEEMSKVSNFMALPYLVESVNGDLLAVFKLMNSVVGFIGYDEDDDEYQGSRLLAHGKAGGFEVFKIDKSSNTTTGLIRLNSLGDQILFLMKSTSSLSVATGRRNLVHGFGNNCMFFLDDTPRHRVSERFLHLGFLDCGVFYLEDGGRISRPFPCMENSIYCQQIWFSPNLYY